MKSAISRQTRRVVNATKKLTDYLGWLRENGAPPKRQEKLAVSIFYPKGFAFDFGCHISLQASANDH